MVTKSGFCVEGSRRQQWAEDAGGDQSETREGGMTDFPASVPFLPPLKILLFCLAHPRPGTPGDVTRRGKPVPGSPGSTAVGRPCARGPGRLANQLC